MSYNKQTSLAANVEAIETAVKIHVQGRKAMAKEKETLSRYSGFGGIKEVLNIGTDNPLPDNMAEPMNRLQKALRTLAGGEETMYRKLTDSLKASVLTAFYTPQFLVDAVARHAGVSGHPDRPRRHDQPRSCCCTWHGYLLCFRLRQ